VDEARELLSAAIASLREIDAGSFVVEVQARLAEAALFAGDSEAALAAADEAEAITGTSAPPAVQALLHRIRGQALRRSDRTEDAAREFDESLRIAREGGMLYEAALTLRARAKLTGSDEDTQEAQRIFHELDVIDVAWLPWAT
jgi:tetratricopeptide (TPR) repeat protein